MRKLMILSLILVFCLSISAVVCAQEHIGAGQNCQMIRDSLPDFYYSVFGEDATIGDCASNPQRLCKAAKETNSYIFVKINGEWQYAPFDSLFHNVGDCVSTIRAGK